jgi:hypothetical protein
MGQRRIVSSESTSNQSNTASRPRRWSGSLYRRFPPCNLTGRPPKRGDVAGGTGSLGLTMEGPTVGPRIADAQEIANHNRSPSARTNSHLSVQTTRTR